MAAGGHECRRNLATRVQIVESEEFFLVIGKMVALIMSLGMDTLMMSIALCVVPIRGKFRIALTFATAEALMPLVGLLIGKTAGHWIGDWAALIGGLALIVMGIWLFFFEDDDDEEEKLERNLVGWTLIGTALSISVDELAVGFSIGLVGVPVALTIILIAIQAFIFTVLGLTFGARLKRYVGEWTEKLAGVVLGLVGIWIGVNAVIYLIYPR